MVKKSLSFTVRVYLNLQLSFFTKFREKLFCMQTTKALISQQFYQLSLESMIAKPATCKKKKKNSCQTCVRRSRQFQWGWGEGRIASRGRFVPVCLLGNNWQLMIFMGRSRPPVPSVSAHIRVSNSLNSHFIYCFLLGMVNSQNVCLLYQLTPRAKTA